jgi:predicted ATP-grasp superfamily ATP-dependent carboligase
VFDLVGASLESTVEHLLLAGQRLGSRAILIPTWDDLAILVADAEPALREQFLLPRQPNGLARSLASKREMHRLAIEHGVPTPQASFPASIDDVRAFAADAAFPVMIKGIFGNRLHQRAGRALFVAERPTDLVRLYRDLEDPANPNLMLQEYIPGGDDAVWMFNGYFDADSECLFGLTGRKLRQTPAYAGTTSLGVCLPNELVDRLTRRWMKALGYRGMIDMGYRYDARDEQYKVLDVNPRIGSTFRLFVGRHGLDVVRALYLDLTGQPVPADVMIEGRRWLDEHDFASSRAYRRDGKLTMCQWAASLRRVQESIYVARDDVAPFARLGLQVLGASLRGSRR